MTRTKGVIRTQKDLNEMMEKENGMYYISLNGLVAIFGNDIKLNLVKANEKMEQIATGSSEAISKAMVTGNKKEAKEFLDVLIQTYLVPFRIQ